MAQLGNTNIYGNLTITGTTTSSGNFIGNLTGNITGNASGNAATATKLKSSINLTTTDGTNTSTAVSFDGSAATSIKLPATIKADLIGNVEGNASSSYSCSGNSATATLASQANQIRITTTTNSRPYYLSFTDAAATYNNLYTNTDVTYNPSSGVLKAPIVQGAVWNDLADSIPLGEGDTVEPGYCYCFDGEHYAKTSEYMQQSYIGIHSDTYGFRMGYEEGKEKLDVAVSGFVLAYVDKDYPVGTPLTCTKDGYLTEISKEDKRDNPEMVIAKYWKSEPNEEWGIDNKKVKVNGRRWIKIK